MARAWRAMMLRLVGGLPPQKIQMLFALVAEAAPPKKWRAKFRISGAYYSVSADHQHIAAYWKNGACAGVIAIILRHRIELLFITKREI